MIGCCVRTGYSFCALSSYKLYYFREILVVSRTRIIFTTLIIILLRKSAIFLLCLLAEYVLPLQSVLFIYNVSIFHMHSGAKQLQRLPNYYNSKNRLMDYNPKAVTNFELCHIKRSTYTCIKIQRIYISLAGKILYSKVNAIFWNFPHSPYEMEKDFQTSFNHSVKGSCKMLPSAFVRRNYIFLL